MDSRAIGAFVEHVGRPLMEDARVLMETLQKLNLPLSERLIKRTCFYLGAMSLLKELIRSFTYIVIAGVLGRVAFQAILAYP